jgi:hypothetical protein
MAQQLTFVEIVLRLDPSLRTYRPSNRYASWDVYVYSYLWFL